MAQIRQVWRTTSANEKIVIPICPGTYFGSNITNLKLEVKWDPSDTVVQSIDVNDPNQPYALEHTFSSPGDHEIWIAGGWHEQATKNALDRNRLLAFATEQDRPPGTTPGKLIHWYNYNSVGGAYSTRLQAWQKDSNGNPLLGEVGTEVVRQLGFYLAGEGTFKDFTNMDNWPQYVEPIYSDDPSALIQKSDDANATINMNETFMNCSALVGKNIWSFKSWGHKAPTAGRITSMARCFKNAIASVVTDNQKKYMVGRTTEKQTAVLPDGSTQVVTVVTNPGVETYFPVAGTQQTRAVFNIWAWGVSNCTDFSECFRDSGVRMLDLNRWQLGSALNMDHMFAGCTLERLSLGKNGRLGSEWNTRTVTSMKGMFHGCNLDQLKILAPVGHKNHGKDYPRENYLKDFPLLNVESCTDFTDMFRDSNINMDLTRWDVDNATAFEDFRTNSALTVEHMPDFTYPHADIEIVDFTGNATDQYLEVQTYHTDEWMWSVNDGAPSIEQPTTTNVKLNNMQFGLNTLELSAIDVEGNLDDEELNYVLALTAAAVTATNTVTVTALSTVTVTADGVCPSIVVDDLSANDTSLEIDVLLYEADHWQYSVDGTATQEVTVNGTNTVINNLSHGVNVLLLSALDANGDYLAASKTVVILGSGQSAGGGGAGGGGGSGLPSGGTIWWNPDPHPAAVAPTANATFGLGRITARAVGKKPDSQTMADIFGAIDIYKIRSIRTNMHVNDVNNSTGSLTLEQAVGAPFNIYQIKELRTNVHVDDVNNSTGSLTLEQAVGVPFTVYNITDMSTTAMFTNKDPITPYPTNTIWTGNAPSPTNGGTDPEDYTALEFESTIVPKIHSYLQGL